MSLRQPKRYPVKFYSWQDTGAPQLSNNDGVIKTILKACLVTGYGDKEGAGWQMPFEDDYRMVLKMPMRTGNPPDIRLENGVVNGVDSHKICGLYDATGLDDTPLTQTNILTKLTNNHPEWFLVASDFGFWLYVPFGENGFTLNRQQQHHVMYCGAVMVLNNTQPKYVITQGGFGVQKSGYAGVWLFGINYPDGIKNLTSGKNISLSLANLNINEVIDGTYMGQRAFLTNGDCLPIYASMTDVLSQGTPSQLTLNGRPMLRTPQQSFQSHAPRAYYVPLDYWEL